MLPEVQTHIFSLSPDWLDDPRGVVTDEFKEQIKLAASRLLERADYSSYEDRLRRIESKVKELAEIKSYTKGNDVDVVANLNHGLNGFRIGIYPHHLDISFRKVRNHWKQKDRIDILIKQTGKYIAPIRLFTVEGKRNNGTVFFWNTGKRTIMITADHVYQDYLKNKNGSSIMNNSLDPGDPKHIDLQARLIDNDKHLDIATFDISPDELVFDSNVKVKCEAFNGRVYQNPRENDSVIFTGYPGDQIITDHQKRENIFGICSYTTSITGAGVEIIRLDLDKQDHRIFASVFNGSAPDYERHINHLGGKSGCPLFKFNVDKNCIIQNELKLCGVVTECDKDDDMPCRSVKATKIKLIDSNGFIDRSNNPAHILGKK